MGVLISVGAACFRVPIPNQHTPGNYINAQLSTAADLHDEFRVFAHYEAETPWNQISLVQPAC